MAAVTWLAVFPIVTVIFSVFGRWLNLLPPLVRTLVFSAVMVTLMTYVVMPRMTRLFSFWLCPDRKQRPWQGCAGLARSENRCAFDPTRPRRPEHPCWMWSSLARRV